ncbi:unnamed protein product [Sphagnum troendelagicum]|uniref:Uncharacterized protein n=1 Tax=Sphagnum troendelagicum TaxID=128251 RepID=A0ABP0TGM6_9BRYO
MSFEEYAYIWIPYSSGSGARFPAISASTTVHHVTVQGLPSTEEVAEKWYSKHHLHARGRPDHQLLRARTTLAQPESSSRQLLAAAGADSFFARLHWNCEITSAS